jgi:peptide/nickel transport system substrate-binding protein
LLLQRGDADVARDLVGEQLKKAQADKSIRIIAKPKASLMYLSMNLKTQGQGLEDWRVRHAIRWAIDYQAIVNGLVPGTFKVHQAFLPTVFSAAITDNPFSFRPDRAKALLAKAGYPNGLTLSLDHGSSSPHAEIARALQTQMSQAGIRLTLIPRKASELLTIIRSRQHQLAVSFWGSDYIDPHSNAQAFCVNDDNQDVSSLRTVAWTNCWVDEDLKDRALAAAKEEKLTKRKAMYKTMQRDLMKRGPFAIIAQETAIVAVSKQISGLVPGPISNRTSYAGVVVNVAHDPKPRTSRCKS